MDKSNAANVKKKIQKKTKGNKNSNYFLMLLKIFVFFTSWTNVYKMALHICLSK